LEEELPHRLTETVDALLHVADVEKVLPVPGQRAEDGVLRGVDVLTFVDKDILIAGGDLPCRRRRDVPAGAVLLRQQPSVKCSRSA
jgi:hypothetical protein